MAYQRLTLATALDDGVAVIKLAGELDASEVSQLDEALREAEGTPGVKRVEVDITQLDFMDSSGIAALAFATERSRSDGDKLRITRSTPAVERVLAIAGLADYLPRSDLEKSGTA